MAQAETVLSRLERLPRPVVVVAAARRALMSLSAHLTCQEQKAIQLAPAARMLERAAAGTARFRQEANSSQHTAAAAEATAQLVLFLLVAVAALGFPAQAAMHPARRLERLEPTAGMLEALERRAI